MRVKAPIALFVVATEALFLLKLGPFGVEYVLSSLLVTVALLLQLTFAVRSDAPSPASIIVFIFNWLFLHFAPRLQLIYSHTRLINTSSVVPGRVLTTDLMCAIFIGVYTALYAALVSRRQKESHRSIASQGEPPEVRPYRPLAILTTVVVCCIAVVIVRPYVIAIGDSMAYGSGSTSSPMLLLGSKYFLFLPSAAFLILLNETVSRSKAWTFSRGCVLLILLVLVAATENPSLEGRNSLGPIYLGIILVAGQRWLRTFGRQSMLLLGGMVFVFPIAGLLTHNGELSFQSIVDSMENHYLELHYDAWANTYSTIEFVHRKGLAWGHQLGGTLLFFVPSAWWHGKASATGIVIGRYLMATYKMWFTNLSAPLVAEGYIDFGVAGVAAYACALAALVSALERLACKDSWYAYPLSIYFSIFLLFALRGALMAAFAYGAGEMAAFLTIALLLSRGRKQKMPFSGRYQSPALS